jgi:hypothetical protein
MYTMLLYTFGFVCVCYQHGNLRLQHDDVSVLYLTCRWRCALQLVCMHIAVQLYTPPAAHSCA